MIKTIASDTSHSTTLDLNGVIRDIVRMAGRLIGENVRLITMLEPALGTVMADRGQIEQVLMNLVVNARDAMPGGGTLILESANVEVDEAAAGRHEDMKPVGYVLLTLTDTGIGMDAATRSRIFEPFFTTKGPGEGTGLGLSTAYGIVKKCGGWIWL